MRRTIQWRSLTLLELVSSPLIRLNASDPPVDNFWPTDQKGTIKECAYLNPSEVQNIRRQAKYVTSQCFVKRLRSHLTAFRQTRRPHYKQRISDNFRPIPNLHTQHLSTLSCKNFTPDPPIQNAPPPCVKYVVPPQHITEQKPWSISSPKFATRTY